MSEASHVMPIRHAIDGQVQALYQENCELKIVIRNLKSLLKISIGEILVDQIIKDTIDEFRTRTNQGKDFNSQENTSNS